MTNYVFSEMTQEQATAFKVQTDVLGGVLFADRISFSVSASSLVLTAQTSSGFFPSETITINNGSKSLDFKANGSFSSGTPGDFYASSSATSFSFADGSRLIFGDDNASDTQDNEANTISGTGFNDQIFGLGGNDTINGAAGNDKIHGGDGLDIAEFSIARASASITRSSDILTVTGEGTDTLDTIERLKFSDGTLAFDLDGAAGQTFRLYRAAFDREPDQAGLAHNIAQMDGGLSIYDMAAAFIASAEFTQTYGAGITDTAFLTLLYQNVLNRAPDQAGLDGWLSQLSSGDQSRQQVLFGFSESAENKAATASLTDDGIWLG